MSAPIRQAHPTDATLKALDRARHHAQAWLEGLDERPVGATTDLATLRARLDLPLAEGGVEPTRVVDELVAALDGGLHGSGGGRFFAWVIGGALPSALAADWLVSAWDNNAALFHTSPGLAVVEEVVGAWLLDLLDLPRDASFALTTGCQLAHMTALAAARHAVLRDAGWDVNARGLFGAPPIRVLVSEHRHGSIDRAVRFLGIGQEHVVTLSVDDAGAVTADSLAAALADHDGPTIVSLDAADLNIAAFDGFETLVPMAQAAGAWVHIDGAFGLFARASAKLRGLTAGLELADSWACDGHKWLNVPFDCGYAFVRDAEAHRAAMTLGASYIAPGGDARDQIDFNLEWSRRGRGVATYAALRELGRDGLAAMIERCCDHAHALVTGLGALDGAELLWEPTLNQGLVRFLDRRQGARERDHDERTDAVMAAINATGEAYVSGTTWHGRRAMRVSVVNWRTTDDDVARTLEAARAVLEGRA